MTCAFAGSVTTVIASNFGLTQSLVALACGAVAFILRAGSISFGWRLPIYKSRPPRV